MYFWITMRYLCLDTNLSICIYLLYVYFQWILSWVSSHNFIPYLDCYSFIVHCMTKIFRNRSINFRELEEFHYPIGSYHQIQMARSLRRINLARFTPRPSIPRIPTITRPTPTLQRQISLPSYENVMSLPNDIIDESPPPTYDEIVLKIDS